MTYTEFLHPSHIQKVPEFNHAGIMELIVAQHFGKSNLYKREVAGNEGNRATPT